MLNKKLVVSSLSALLLSSSATAFGQMAQQWNVEAHHKAEVENSAGLTLLAGRQIDRAITVFKHATQQDPTDDVPFQSLALALAMRGKYAESLDALQKAYSLKPATETLLSTGIVYYLQHDYDAALNAFNKILQANPKMAHIYGDMGWAFMRKGQLDEAEKCFQKLVKASPNSHLGYHGLALVHYLQGEFRQARDSAERAESIEFYPPVELLLAKIDVVQGDRSRAAKRAQHYNSAIRRKWQQRSMTELGYPMQHDFHWDPFLADQLDNGHLLLARAELLNTKAQLLNPGKVRSESRLGKAQQVITQAKQELTLADDDPLLNHELGLAELADGNYSSAADHFKQVLEKAPGWNVDRLNLGHALALDGKSDQGSEQVREFQQHNPTQEISRAFTEISKEDPSRQLETSAQKMLPRIEPPGPKPLPGNSF